MNEMAVRYILFPLMLLALMVFPVAADDGPPTTGSVSSPLILSYGTLFPVHAILMTLGFLCFVTAASFPAFRKGKPGWLGNHQILASAGTVLSIAAFATAYLMVGSSGGPHLRVPHAYLGAAVVIVMVLTYLLGHLRLRMKPYILQAIALHRWTGRVLLLLMALTVISGLFTSGLLT